MNCRSLSSQMRRSWLSSISYSFPRLSGFCTHPTQSQFVSECHSLQVGGQCHVGSNDRVHFIWVCVFSLLYCRYMRDINPPWASQSCLLHQTTGAQGMCCCEYIRPNSNMYCNCNYITSATLLSFLDKLLSSLHYLRGKYGVF
jgi:hypothetical protein